MTIQAIPTWYAGCYFRSRLEARWAVFFDALGIPWNYEPDGWDLVPKTSGEHYKSCPYGTYQHGSCNCRSHLGWYLPDFWLPTLNTWFEVKGVWPGDDAARAREERLGDLTERPLITALGGIPDPTRMDCSGHPYPSATEPFDLELTGCDIHQAWCVCPWCNKPGIEFDGRGARVCGWKAHHSDYAEAERVVMAQGHWRADDKCYTGDAPMILAAYSAARSARFEHGQSGASS